MRMIGNTTRKADIRQRGAALVTVVLISVLLLTASVAMLTAVGANSRNTTDVLSETKAYYAAESGLQATINELRNDSTASYTAAVADPDMSTWLPYNWPTTGTATRAVIGQAPGSYTPNTGAAYSIVVDDPDNTQVSTTFNTLSGFLSGGDIVGGDPKVIDVPNTAAADRTRITLTNAAATTVTFGTSSNPVLTTVRVENFGSGAALATGTKINFRIDYRMTAPLPPGSSSAVVSLWGTLEPAVNNGPPVIFKFGSEVYSLFGSPIDPCSAANSTAPCASPVVTLTPGLPATALYVNIQPVKPFRLRVSSTGYGPSGAVKKLEGIIQRNLFNGLGPGAATTMLGPNCTPGAAPLDHCFDPGNSNGANYSGGDCASSAGCVPSFGMTNAQYLAYVAANPPHGDPAQMQPPPEVLDTSIMPSWQQDPASMESTIVNPERGYAQTHAGYFTDGSRVTNPGNYAQGTGLTFCEGSCEVSGDGGGLLIVTGKLTNLGGFNFKGTIIVVGEEGWERNGGGNGQIIGNVIIAPYYYMLQAYAIGNVSSTWLPPRYYITGGGGSDIIYSDTSSTFDNTSAISDLMAGVAEK
jgi:Tfp pilus assembly protein PilX